MQETLEQVMIRLWKEVLGVTDIDVNTSFFEIGGTSLGAEKIASRFRLFSGIEIRGFDILRAQTVGGILRHISEQSPPGKNAASL